MKIETKYDIRQEVWFMEDDKVKSENILKISLSKSISEEIILYHFKDRNTQLYWERNRKEAEVFATKEELIKSL